MPTVEELGTASYLRLTTFRRDGTPAPTPVWVARDGDRLAVVTTASTGKVKRLRHTSRVLISVCDRRGRVAPGTPEAQGTATVDTDPAAIERLGDLLVRKYGFAARAMRFLWGVRGTETVRIDVSLTTP